MQKNFVHWIETERAKLLYNVVLPEECNAQIDAILIDISGIYIIECKCWKGTILGKYDEKYWLVIALDRENGIPVIQKENEPFYCKSIYNPLKQNEYHKNAVYYFLNNEIGKSYNQFKRFTVFDNCGNIDFIIPSKQKPVDPQMKYTWAGGKDNLCDAIETYDTTTPEGSRLSHQDVNLIYNKLKPYAESCNIK